MLSDLGITQSEFDKEIAKEIAKEYVVSFPEETDNEELDSEDIEEGRTGKGVPDSVYQNVDRSVSASWTDERIDKLIDYYGASNPDYAKAYATAINPMDFLRLTLPEAELRRWISYIETGKRPGDFFKLDVEKLKDNDQEIMLYIDESKTKVYSHEGRYRMLALSKAGIKSVPITLIDFDTKYDKKSKNSLRFSVQQN